MSKEKGEDDELTHFSQPSLIKDPVTFSCSDESIMLRSLGSSVLNRSTRRSSAIPFRQWPDRRRLAMSVRSSYGSSRTCDGGRSATSESQSVWVDLLPPLNLHRRPGKLVLERSELGKSCLHFLHCLTKNLTLHSSTNTASGIIVAFPPCSLFIKSHSPKRQRAPIMRLKGQIPAEAF